MPQPILLAGDLIHDRSIIRDGILDTRPPNNGSTCSDCQGRGRRQVGDVPFIYF